MSEQKQPTKTYLEVFADGAWTTVEAFSDDDARALRALTKAREQQPQARLRITDETARVLLDVSAAEA